MKFKPFPRPTGDAAGVVVTEYHIPPPDQESGEFVDADGSDWSEGIPSSINQRGVHDVAIDLDGNAWITSGEPNRYRTYAKVNTVTGKVTNFKVPGPNGFARRTHGIKTDQKGIIWMEVRDSGPNDRHVLGRLDPRTEAFEMFDPSSVSSATLGNTIEVDPQGKVWTAARPGAYVFDPVTKKFIHFKGTTPTLGGYGIAGDANGNGWFCNLNWDIIGFANYKTGKVSELRLRPRQETLELATPEDLDAFKPIQGASAPGDAVDEPVTGRLPLRGLQSPRRMGAGGNFVWWANWWGASISSIDIRTHEIRYYPIPFPDSQPYGMDVDKNGMVWVTLFVDEHVAKFDPRTERWTTYRLPSLGNELRHLTVDDSKEIPEVWVASFRTSKLARLQFRTREQLDAVASAQR